MSKLHYLLPLAPLLLGSCSVEKHLAKREASIQQEFAASKSWAELPLRPISWGQALAILETNNLELRRAQSAIDKSSRDRLSVYSSLIPGVSYYSYMSNSIRELSHTRQDDISQQINITFNMPVWTQVPYQVYSAQARQYFDIKAKEGKRRELISQLYQQVRLREIEGQMQALEAGDKQTPQGKESPRPASEQQQSEDEYWSKIGKLLGDNSARWSIDPQSMPHAQWNNYSQKLEHPDPLRCCLFAAKLEQAKMAQYGLAVSYLPSFNSSLYSPSLFSSSGGNYSGTFLSDKDTRLMLNLGYSLDSKMNHWYSYKESKENYENTKREVAADIQEFRNKLQRLKSSVNEYYSWRSFMEKRIAFLEKQESATAEDYLNRTKLLQDMRRELLTQEKSAVESEAALVLEYGMPDEKLREAARQNKP